MRFQTLRIITPAMVLPGLEVDGKGASRNSEFAQMQGAEKICEHPQRGLPAYPTSPRRICTIC